MSAARIFGIAFLTGFSGAMMPGPLLALTIGQVAATGFPAALWLITGHALLELVLVILLMLGLRTILAREKVRGGIGLIGGAALLYMGVDMIRNAAALHLGVRQGEAMSIPYLLLAGAAVSLANPYFTGWWATIGVGQLAQTGPQTRGQYLAFYLGHELSDYVWYAFVAILIVAARGWLAGSWYNWLVGLCGGAVVLLALWFLYNGIRLLRPQAVALSPEP
jgi:threonine/homoserine/homoserine lactone efflux protein